MDFSNDFRLDGQPEKSLPRTVLKALVKAAYAVIVTAGILLFFGLMVGVPN